MLSSVLNEWPVKEVSVERREDEWSCFSDVFKKFEEKRPFVWLVEHCKASNIVFWFRSILEILYITSNDVSVRYEESSVVNNVRNHHDGVELGVRKLERSLGRLNVKSHDSEVGFVQFVVHVLEVFEDGSFHGDLVPLRAPDFIVNHDSNVVAHIMFSDLNDLAEELRR